MAVEAPRLQGTTMYLLRTDVQDFVDALREDRSALSEYPLRNELGIDGVVYVRPLPNRSPGWLQFLENSVGQTIAGVGTRQGEALLLFRAAERMVAVTFGLGRYLLAMDRCVPDFGLRVALNVVDPDQIRSVDGRAIEDIILLTRRQGSRGVAVETLGLQASREMLRAITGIPVDTELGTRVSGTASLSIAKTVNVRELAARTPKLIGLYAADDYRERFGYIDRIRPVDDAGLLAALDALLLSSLAAPGAGGAYLAEPEIVDFQSVAGYRYTGEARDAALHSTLSLDDYLAVHGAPDDAGSLRRHRVNLIGGDTDSTVRSWFVYDTLVFEVLQGPDLYVLSEGAWFAVDTNYAREVDERIASIRVSDLALPDSLPNETEGDYNARVTLNRDDWATLDADTVHFPGERGPVEVCDVMTADGQLVHVKRGFEAHDLSHLFLQGLNSAGLFRNSQPFREVTRDKLLAKARPRVADAVPGSKPDRNQFEVIYAIITPEPERVPTKLPFFSRLSLDRCVEQLQALDYRVSVRGVTVPSVVTPRRRRPRRAA